MSAKRLGRAKPSVEIRKDENIASYDAERDPRAGQRIQRVRLDRIVESRFQVRRVFPLPKIEALADSIEDDGLIHVPVVRPHPERPGFYELVPGELRIRALRLLAERGQGRGVLEFDGEGNALAPVYVERIGDERAEAMVLSENLKRADLSPWEKALALQQRRRLLDNRNAGASVREVASSVKEPPSTVGDHLLVADNITLEVLEAADVVRDGEADHERLSELSLAALKRVAQTIDQGTARAAEQLHRELRRVSDSAVPLATPVRNVLQTTLARTPLDASPFQVNIRSPVGQLSPAQARRYLGRMAPVVGILAERTRGEMPEREARHLADALEAAAARLRGG